MLQPVVSSSLLADQVADRIVDAIATRDIVGGERLIETDLAQKLQVSRIPIREAMRVLESQGVVVATPRRGMRVIEFDDAWAQQLHDIRVAIERVSARLASSAVRTNLDARRQVEERVDAVARSTATGDWRVINAADIAFHTQIFEIAAAPLLLKLWTAIARHVLILFSIETYRDRNFERVISEHQRYLDVLLDGVTDSIDLEIARHVAGRRTFPTGTEIQTQH